MHEIILQSNSGVQVDEVDKVYGVDESIETPIVVPETHSPDMVTHY